MKLYYDHPAENWHESLPLGNGRIGAMVYGGTKKEILALNEDTLWSGYPEKTQKKLPEGVYCSWRLSCREKLGRLTLGFIGGFFSCENNIKQQAE